MIYKKESRFPLEHNSFYNDFKLLLFCLIFFLKKFTFYISESMKKTEAIGDDGEKNQTQKSKSRAGIEYLTPEQITRINERMQKWLPMKTGLICNCQARRHGWAADSPRGEESFKTNRA